MSTQTTARILGLKAIADRLSNGLPPEGRAHHRALQSEVASLHRSAAALDAMRLNADPTITPAAHAKRVMEGAAKLREQVSAARERIHKITQEGARDLDRRIAAKVNLKPDGFAAEVRAQFRTLPEAKRQRLLHDLALKNRGPELAALIDAPEVLTGISDEHRARYRDLIISTHAAEEYEEAASLMAAFGVALDAAPVVLSVATDFSDPVRLAEIERAEQAAAAAQAAFDSAVQA